MANGKFTEDPGAAEIVAQMTALASPMRTYVEENCVVGKGFETNTQTLYHDHCTWRRANGHMAIASNTFGASLRAAFPHITVKAGFSLLPERMEGHAADLVKAGVDVIVVGGDAAVRAAQRATARIPILAFTDDMLDQGFVRSLAKPDGNTTGVTILASELDGKRQEILIEAVPGVRRIAVLADANISTPPRLRALEEAARARGIELSIHSVAYREEIGSAIDAAKAVGAEGLNVLASALVYNSRAFIFDRARALRLPAVYQWPQMAEEGGLIGYGPLIVPLFRDAMSRQLAKLLRGAQPGDLPVEQPTRFELAINLKTARAIGHDVPGALVVRADKVIELATVLLAQADRGCHAALSRSIALRVVIIFRMTATMMTLDFLSAAASRLWKALRAGLYRLALRAAM